MAGSLNSVVDLFFSNDVGTIEDLCIISEPKPKPGTELERGALRLECNVVGIASWALPDLYTEAKQLLSLSSSDLRAATAMLVINPEHLRAWSIRKRHLSETTVEVELTFSALILRRSPKSDEAWSHRAWVLRFAAWTSELIEQELKIATTAATQARSNYYAGVHRLLVLQYAQESTVVNELVKNRTWLQLHVGDSSGWWYHNALLTKLIAGDHFNMAEESVFIRDMQSRYGHKFKSVKQQFFWWEKQLACR